MTSGTEDDGVVFWKSRMLNFNVLFLFLGGGGGFVVVFLGCFVTCLIKNGPWIVVLKKMFLFFERAECWISVLLFLGWWWLLFFFGGGGLTHKGITLNAVLIYLARDNAVLIYLARDNAVLIYLARDNAVLIYLARDNAVLIYLARDNAVWTRSACMTLCRQQSDRETVTNQDSDNSVISKDRGLRLKRNGCEFVKGQCVCVWGGGGRRGGCVREYVCFCVVAYIVESKPHLSITFIQGEL